MAKLWQDAKGNFSAAKFWATVAYLAGTVIVVELAFNGHLTWEIFIGYLAVVGGADVAKKWITVAYAPKAIE
jgi:hypothetical protein